MCTKTESEQTTRNLSVALMLFLYHAIAFVGGCYTFSWSLFVLMLVLYVFTGLGITVGYHRLFTHKSFETYGVIRWLAAIIGTFAGQGSCISWVSSHRVHHQYSDEPGDPHSPALHKWRLFGFLWAHMLWLFARVLKVERRQEIENTTKDLQKDPIVRGISRHYLLLHFGQIVVLALIGYLISGWYGALAWIVWGYVIRVLVTLHLTWSVNSSCHMFGYRSYQTRDKSRNSFLFGLLALGEGWHNNHHWVQWAANHGQRWWEFDASFCVIRFLERLGLAWGVKRFHPKNAKKQA